MQYKYNGDGAGIPGLPHLISQEEIDQMNEGMRNEFEAALATGAYVEINESAELPTELSSRKRTRKPSPAEGE